MKNALIAAAIVAATTVAAPVAAQAQEAAKAGAYVNLNVGLADFDATLWVAGGRVGYRFNDYVGVEGELAFGLKGDEVTVAGVEADVSLKHEAAAYLVGFLPVDDNTDLIARVGYGTAKVKASVTGGSASLSEESFNFGVGAQHHFDGLNGIRADFTRQEFQDDGGSANVWTVGYSRKF